MWLYDIMLKDGTTVGNQGDEDFKTKEDAFDDAMDFIICELCEEYNKSIEDFEIQCYEAFC